MTSCVTFHLLFLRSGWESTRSLLKKGVCDSSDGACTLPYLLLVIYPRAVSGPLLFEHPSSSPVLLRDHVQDIFLLSPLPRKRAIFYFISLGNSRQGLNHILACRQQTKLFWAQISIHLLLPVPHSNSVLCQCCMHIRSQAGTEPNGQQRPQQEDWEQVGCGPRRAAAVKGQWWHTDSSGSCIRRPVLWHSQGWGRWHLNWNLKGAPSETFPSLPCSCPGKCSGVFFYRNFHTKAGAKGKGTGTSDLLSLWPGSCLLPAALGQGVSPPGNGAWQGTCCSSRGATEGCGLEQ